MLSDSVLVKSSREVGMTSFNLEMRKIQKGSVTWFQKLVYVGDLGGSVD